MKFLVPVGGTNEGWGTIAAPNKSGVMRQIKAGGIWAADCGGLIVPSYVKKADFKKTIKWLSRDMLPYKKQNLFVAGFDVVGDASATLEAFYEYREFFPAWKFAYCAQNGAEDLEIPKNCGAVCIGGDTKWKESAAAVTVIKRAQAMGKHIHILRVNWYRRYKIFNVLKGSEKFTCDGTRTRYGGKEKTLKAWAGYQAQRPLIAL